MTISLTGEELAEWVEDIGFEAECEEDEDASDGEDEEEEDDEEFLRLMTQTLLLHRRLRKPKISMMLGSRERLRLPTEREWA